MDPMAYILYIYPKTMGLHPAFVVFCDVGRRAPFRELTWQSQRITMSQHPGTLGTPKKYLVNGSLFRQIW